MIINNLTGYIQSLEEKILHGEFNSNQEFLEQVVDRDFIEIDNNGRVNKRQDVMQWLAQKDLKLRWSLEDFKLQVVTGDVVVAVYRTSGSIRSSIWQCKNDFWTLVFHQGTKLLGS